jgi:glycosyltransferase involved in cell wall biosynthesis
VKAETTIESPPVLSIIVAVYNDWLALDACLQSLARQTGAPSFEVIIVDDGSKESSAESTQNWTRYYPLTIVRQSHAGVSIARNRGIQVARGPVLVFVDADSRLQPDCFAALQFTIANSPRQSCFQLHLVGDCTNSVGRAEQLRLSTLQSHLLQPDGYIRYLNTAGFAIRRSKISGAGNLFDPEAMRAEDTLLLADLMQREELPLFVANAIVQHQTALSLGECIRKDIRSAYLESNTYEAMALRGVGLRVSYRERVEMLRFMWQVSAEPSIGRGAWFVLTIRQILRLIVHFVCRASRRWRQPSGVNS